MVKVHHSDELKRGAVAQITERVLSDKSELVSETPARAEIRPQFVAIRPELPRDLNVALRSRCRS